MRSEVKPGKKWGVVGERCFSFLFVSPDRLLVISQFIGSNLFNFSQVEPMLAVTVISERSPCPYFSP